MVIPRPLPPNCCIRSVAWGPGQTRFKVIPDDSAARSAAAVFAQAHRPTRAVLDRARLGRGWTTEYDEMQQIRPQPWARIGGTAARTNRTALNRLASTASRMA